MKRLILLTGLFLATVLLTFGSGEHNHDHDVTFIKNRQRVLGSYEQQVLRESAQWQNFLSNNGTWYVYFDEESKMPHRAYGKPITVAGPSNPLDKALNFIQNNLQDFQIDLMDLELTGVSENGNHYFVNFKQHKQGVEVLFSRVTVKMDMEMHVVLFGLEYHAKAELPQFSPKDAGQLEVSAMQDLHGIVSVAFDNDIKILPIPGDYRYEFRPVHSIIVYTKEDDMPGEYHCLVDAETGVLHYRQNKIVQVGTDVTGSVSMQNATSPLVPKGLMYIYANIGGTNFIADEDGNIDFTPVASTNVTVQLKSDWCNVRINNNTLSFTTTISPGNAVINTNSEFVTPARTAYYHTNLIHDSLKARLPAFVGLDVSLNTNVELTTGNCNAFYNGTSINFYTTAGGCHSLALFPDVVYHEYGHGITNRFWQQQGVSFQNGAIGEGYSDVWATYITQNPILAQGWQTTSSTTFIRRYDINPKVYPQDLVGQVHADGEIIAGCFWDLGIELNNPFEMMKLHTASYYGLPNGPTGTEGILYTDILVDVLQEDDSPANGGDNDITNGTPNDQAIVNAFAMHGITLLANATMIHTPIEFATIGQPINVNSTIILDFPWALSGAKMYYHLNESGNWQTTVMTNTSGNNWTAQVPAQPEGTLIAYYIALEDVNGNLSSVRPAGANMTDPTLPYFILVGYNQDHIEDFDFNQGAWQEGIAGDDATTGNWIIDVPVPSYTSPGNPATMVQPGYQTTPGGLICAVTGNAPSPSDGIGVNDIDGGKTTLQSPPFDMSGMTNPIITYQRWYTNSTGAAPNDDWWRVYVSNNGTNWVFVEQTKRTDQQWRKNAIQLTNYIPTSATVYIRFVAADEGDGSLVEAAVDDIIIYNQSAIGLEEVKELSYFNVYPNPANNYVMVDFDVKSARMMTLTVSDVNGRILHTEAISAKEQNNKVRLNTENYPSGIYQVTLNSGTEIQTKRISVSR